MGRGYIVDDAVKEYLSKICDQHAGPVTGLLIGQSLPQRDFVVLAARTPDRGDSTSAAGGSLDKEWVTEHARQVSRMLPGGLSVLGVFIITDSDDKDTLTTLRQLAFAVDKLISSDCLWSPADDDVTDWLTLHVNPKTRKTVCRTFDVKDPKSAAKPADWKYQANMSSSWSMVSCSLNVDMLVPLTGSRAGTETVEANLKEGLDEWAQQIHTAVCLIDGKMLPKELELNAGQKKIKKQTFTAQLLISPVEKSSINPVQRCEGSLWLGGAVHSRAYLHSNRLKAGLIEKLLKRDVLSTVATRAQLLLEDLQQSETESRGSSTHRQHTEQFIFPRRIFFPLRESGPVCVCDYQFSDEDRSELTDRLKEMLDIDALEEDLMTNQETLSEIVEEEVPAEPAAETVEAPQQKRNNYAGVAMATAVALLATAASMLYLNDV